MQVLHTMCPESKFAIKQKNDNDVTIYLRDAIVTLFDPALYPLSNLVTGPCFLSISSLVLELWQFYFLRDWAEIRKSDTSPSEFCPISGGLNKLEIQNFARVFLIKCNKMVQNARITAFTVSELLSKNLQGFIMTPLTQIRIK